MKVGAAAVWGSGVGALVASVLLAGCGSGARTASDSLPIGPSGVSPTGATGSSPLTDANPPASLVTALCKGPGLHLSTQDDYVYLSGSLCANDGEKFVQYMSTAGQPYSIVRLNLTGGAGTEAVRIGHYLRDHAITTWVDADSDVCTSACNRVFAGGSQRIYSFADDITTGKNPHQRTGLGFHHPNVDGDFQAAESFYQDLIAPYLKEMLPPAGYDWVYQADESNLTYNMIWLNGGQALQLGIATESNPPR